MKTLDDLTVVRLWTVLASFERALANELQPMGLTVSSFRLVGEVMRSPDGLRQAELARRLGIRPPSVSAAVNRLEEAGIVERVPDPDDARARRVQIAQGAALHHGAEVLQRLEDRLIGALSPAERTALDSALRTLSRHLTAPED